MKKQDILDWYNERHHGLHMEELDGLIDKLIDEIPSTKIVSVERVEWDDGYNAHCNEVGIAKYIMKKPVTGEHNAT